MNATGRISDAALRRLLEDVEREAARRNDAHPAEWVSLALLVAFLAALLAGAL